MASRFWRWYADRQFHRWEKTVLWDMVEPYRPPRSFGPLVGTYVAAFYTGVVGAAVTEQLYKCSDYLGLSLELGSFLAGVMISTTDFAHHTLEQVEAIRNLFAALFLASIGMLIHVKFLWNHVDILLVAAILVIIVKSIVITVVVKAFGYSIRTAFVVGLSLAQIGEFAFVLLSRASHLHLVGGKMYLLLLGTTALSLVTAPLIFKLIPAVMHLGILMRWFPSESSMQNEDKATMLETYNRVD